MKGSHEFQKEPHEFQKSLFWLHQNRVKIDHPNLLDAVRPKRSAFRPYILTHVQARQ